MGPPRYVKYKQMSLPESRTCKTHTNEPPRTPDPRKTRQVEPPRPSDLLKTRQIEPPRARILDTFIKSSSDQSDPHMKFKPSSNQFMPTSCQLRVGQYARTISHDSPAPHSYDPTMGRRQRRQPINPPRCSRLLEVPKAFETMDLSKASASVSFL